MITPTPCRNHTTEINSSCRFCVAYKTWNSDKVQSWLRFYGKSEKTFLLRPCHKHYQQAKAKHCEACNQWSIFSFKVSKWYGPWKAKKDAKKIRCEEIKAKRQEEISAADEFVSTSIELHYATKTLSLRNSPPPICGYVYLIENPSFPGWIKAGFCIDIKSRLSSYQTCDPNRGYAVLIQRAIYDKHDTENRLHASLERQATEQNNEWFKIDKITAIALFLKITQRVLKEKKEVV